MKDTKNKSENTLSKLITDAEEMRRQASESLARLNDADNPLDIKHGLAKWATDGKVFKGIGDTVANLPPGWYGLQNSMSGPYLQKADIKDEDLLKLPNPVYESVLNDLSIFWDMEAAYRKHKFPYKRGILLTGSPGNGKTGLINLLAQEVISKHDGIILNIDEPYKLSTFVELFSQIRQINPNQKIVAVIEDLDNFVRYGGGSYSQLLNVLDGNMKYDNITFIASTNYPESLLGNLMNRPSRFDRKYEVKSPSVEARKFYLEKKFPNISAEEVTEMVTASEGFTLDQLKELVLSVYVLGMPKEQVIEEMGHMFQKSDSVHEEVTSMKQIGDKNEISETSMIVSKKK